MKITLNQAEGEKPGRPRLISEIPSISPCLIEGGNGIGKSLAVRLLELISGTQPWTDQALWESLRMNLPPVDIRIEGLRATKTVTAHLDPMGQDEASGWPEQLPEHIGEWLGDVRADGNSKTPDEIGGLLSVVRFAGNEDVGMVMRQELGREGNRLRSLQALTADRLELLRDRAGTLAELLESADPTAQRRRTARVDEVERELEDATRVLEALQSRAAKLERAMVLVADIERRTGLSASEHEQLANLSDDIQALRERDDELKGELDRVLNEIARQGDPEKAFKEEERRRRNRESRAANYRTRVAGLAGQLKLTPNDGLRDELNGRSEELRRQVSELVKRRDELGAGSRVITTIDDLSPPLEAISGDGLGDEVIARLPESAVTVRGLIDGLQKREEELTEEDTPSARHALDEQIEEARDEINQLAELKKEIGKLEGAEKRLKESEDAVASARDAVDKAEEVLKSFDELSQARDKNQGTMRDAVRREAELRSRLGIPAGESEEDLRSDLESLMSELGVALTAELAEKQAELEVPLRDAERDQFNAEASLTAARRELERALSDQRYAIRQIKSDPALGWALEALEDFEARGLDEESALSALAQRARAVDMRVEGVSRMLESLVDLLDAFRVNRRTSAQSELGPALSTALNERLRERLDTPEIRDALFDGNPLKSVDLDEGTLTWAVNGVAVTRPIESFSTGERAFAFTQARVLALEELGDDRDRLLVLDEFGSFVAADRMGQLADFLRSEEVTARATQVLVVLPLQADYASELKETKGSLRTKYESKLEQIDQLGYIAQEFEPELVQAATG